MIRIDGSATPTGSKARQLTDRANLPTYAETIQLAALQNLSSELGYIRRHLPALVTILW